MEAMTVAGYKPAVEPIIITRKSRNNKDQVLKTKRHLPALLLYLHFVQYDLLTFLFQLAKVA